MTRIVAGALAVAVAAAGAAAVAFAAQSPNSLRAAIFAAARKQHSVHYVESGAAQGLHQTMVGDVAGTRGRQRISFTLQTKKGSFTVLVVRRTAYLRGTSLALQGYLGFTAAQAARFHGRWISVPASSKKYADLAASVTLPSFLHDIYPAAPLVLAKARLGGHTRIGVRGTHRESGLKFVEEVFPKASPPLLPVAVADVEPTKGFLDEIKINRWNERVSVQAPANAVPISTVQAS
jgi:hypothetical protein